MSPYLHIVSPKKYLSLSSAEYQALSDETMESLLTALETLVDTAAEPTYEVEYSESFLSCEF